MRHNNYLIDIDKTIMIDIAKQCNLYDSDKDCKKALNIFIKKLDFCNADLVNKFEEKRSKNCVTAE